MSVGSLSCPDVTVWRGPDPTARLSVGASDAVSLSASRHSWGEVLALCKDSGGGVRIFLSGKRNCRRVSPCRRVVDPLCSLKSLT